MKVIHSNNRPLLKIVMQIIIFISITFFFGYTNSYGWGSMKSQTDMDAVTYKDKTWHNILIVESIYFTGPQNIKVGDQGKYTLKTIPKSTAIIAGDKAQGRYYRRYNRYEPRKTQMIAYSPNGEIIAQSTSGNLGENMPQSKAIKSGGDTSSIYPVFTQEGTGAVKVNYEYRYIWEHGKGYLSKDEYYIFKFSFTKEVNISKGSDGKADDSGNQGNENGDVNGNDYDTEINQGPLRIAGEVQHTKLWNIHREKFNQWYFKKQYSNNITFNQYKKLEAPRIRYNNVFWSGEKFILQANVLSGECYKIEATIKNSNYKAILEEEGGGIWKGELWHEKIAEEYSNIGGKELIFMFKGYGNNNHIYEYEIIIDDHYEYWELHRRK